MNVVQYDDGLRPIYAKCIAQARSHIPMSGAIQAGANFDNMGHSGFTISRNKETGELNLKCDF